MKNIDEFVDRLVEDKGITGKDPEVMDQIKKDLSERIYDQVNAMILRNIPEDALEGFSESLDKSDEDAQAYALKYIPDMNEKVAEVLLTFKSMYLS
jgi:hypothetical protein